MKAVLQRRKQAPTGLNYAIILQKAVPLLLMDLLKLQEEKLSIELYVMIRPRGGDFFYSDDEFEIMKADIESVQAVRM